ncbi:MAG: MCE family protein [Candidatus Aminicenantes bacterium]|nr:MCE family protein [Candidatus Aminicenantes bacterium]
MERKREIRVGIFLSGAFVILALVILFVGDVKEVFQKPGYRVYAVFDSALGLENNASVKLAGIKIGLVKGITLDGRRAKVAMSIYPRYQIPRGSKATLASLGILGEKYVEIVPGKENSYYQPEEVMDSLPPISFDQLGTLLLSVGEDIKKLSNSINNTMIKDIGPHFKQTLINLETVTADLDDFLQENKDSIHETIVASEKTVDNLNARVSKVAEGIQDTLKEVQGLVRDNKAGVKDNLEKLKEDLSRLTETIEKLNRILDKVDRGEGTVSRLINEPGLYEETKKTVEQAKKITASISSLQPLGRVEGAYYGESQLFKGGLYGGFIWKNRGIFTGGIIHNPWENKFVYSLQGGWKFWNLGFRAGVIESKFGAGLDWYMLKDRLVLGAESFDFNRQPRPQFRAYGRIYPAKNFYLLFGLDDFTLSSKREFFFGLGFEIR